MKFLPYLIICLLAVWLYLEMNESEPDKPHKLPVDPTPDFTLTTAERQIINQLKAEKDCEVTDYKNGVYIISWQTKFVHGPGSYAQMGNSFVWNTLEPSAKLVQISLDFLEDKEAGLVVPRKQDIKYEIQIETE